MKLKAYFILFFLILLFSNSVFAQSSSVLIVEITDTIDQSTVETVLESLNEAKRKNAQAIILLLDTPGGGLTQTFEIADIIHDSKIPFVGYVYPSGSPAWSAGTFILISTHIAAMADHTIIGSCQPVQVGIDGTHVINDSKTINALVEWISERANMYQRNETLATEFIVKNRNVNATEAKELGIIEFNSESIDQLLIDINGLNVTTIFGNITLNTINTEKIIYSPSFKIQFLKVISNPILTSLLIMIGIFALIFGISSPGYGAEVFGVIAILLSLIGSGFALSTLSIIFIIIGCLLLIIEIFVTPGFGVIGIGGVICLIIGSIFLIPSYPTREWLISSDYMIDALMILLALVAIISLFFVFILYKIIEIRKKKTTIGTFKGEKAKTIDRITPEKPGFILFKGEYWQARSDTIIEPNSKVLIIDKDDTVLIIKPLE
ncbi:MAG: nodulation protein NfeD [Asgard group archaeon]|nr:nodulation protein NfeD [Asgard group archaeon]